MKNLRKSKKKDNIHRLPDPKTDVDLHQLFSGYISYFPDTGRTFYTFSKSMHIDAAMEWSIIIGDFISHIAEGLSTDERGRKRVVRTIIKELSDPESVKILLQEPIKYNEKSYKLIKDVLEQADTIKKKE